MTSLKIIFLLLILYFSIPAIGVADDIISFKHRDRRETVTGTIQQQGQNILSVLDEHDKQMKRFVYIDNQNEFKKGDRVRIHYDTLGNLVVTIKKMTPVEFKKEGQNLGYILKKK